MLSIVIPVYNNEASLPRLFDALENAARAVPAEVEVVFVVDGSPDRCAEILRARLPSYPIPAQLVELSRNFGSLSAIAAGLARGRGEYFAVIAADLQEPPELVPAFYRLLSADEADVVFGYRTGRSDPAGSQLLAGWFWRFYRRFVLKDMPPGGIDVFGCTRMVRDRLLELDELHTNLIALLFWLGFRRAFVPYERQARREGRTSWTLSRRIRYALDSTFSFTDLPLRVLLLLGVVGMAGAVLAAIVVFVAWWRGAIPALGYTPLILAIAFFAGLTAMGFGITGQYLWLTLQNARRRPNFIIKTAQVYPPSPPDGRDPRAP